jgi:hypothetical protein
VGKDRLITSLFIVLSLALHAGLLYLIFARAPLQLGQSYSTRLVLNLQSDLVSSNTTSTAADDTKVEKVRTETVSDKKEVQPNPATELPSASPSSNQPSVWNRSRMQQERSEVRVSERQNMESRFGQQRMQQQSSVNANIAQLIGRLQMMQISVSCALRMSDDFAWATLQCSPSQYDSMIKQGLASSRIRWSEASDFAATSCISITSLSSAQACD